MMEIDTGSDVTVINSKQFEQIQQGCQQLQLTPESMPNLRTYFGKMIQTVGSVTVDVHHQENSYQLPCLVVQGTGPNLIGRDWLEHLKLDWSTVHHIDSVDYARLFPELFREGIGKFNGVRQKLYVDDKVMPRCFKPRPVPLALRGKVHAELDRLQAEGVIRPVDHSDWAAPIVPALKRNVEICICGDYKLTMNVAAKIDKYPIPEVYSKLDLSHDYQQVVLSEKSQKQPSQP